MYIKCRAASLISSGTKRKSGQNFRKHGIEFLDAVVVFDDDRAITIVDEHSDEVSFVSFSMDAQGGGWQLPTMRGGVIRIISARNATRREREQYEDKRR